MAQPHAIEGLRPDRRNATVRLVGLVLVTLAATLAFATDWQSPLRAALVLSFLLLGPGLVLAELLEIRELLQQLAIAAGASLAIETLVALALVYAGEFSTGRAFATIVALTLAAAVVAILRARRPHASVAEPGPFHAGK
jgi:uncharacterized membrane protein